MSSGTAPPQRLTPRARLLLPLFLALLVGLSLRQLWCVAPERLVLSGPTMGTTWSVTLVAGGRSGADVDAARAELAVLRAAEPDLDSPELPIDGLAVAAILGIEPGPAVGEAITRLREHRFEHGPFDAATAAAILESASSD